MSRFRSLIKFLISGSVNCLTNNDFLRSFTHASANAPADPGNAGLSIAATIAASLVNTVAGNLASDHAEKLLNREALLGWLRKKHPDKINHDLDHLLATHVIPFSIQT